jgi:hypothetical protein
MASENGKVENIDPLAATLRLTQAAHRAQHEEGV